MAAIMFKRPAADKCNCHNGPPSSVADAANFIIYFVSLRRGNYSSKES